MRRVGLRGKIVLALGGALLLAMLVASLIGFWHSQRIVITMEKEKIMVIKQQIEWELAAERKNLLTLHDVPPVAAIIRARGHGDVDPVSGDSLREWRQRLTVIFNALLGSHGQYFQIRYVDKEGRELVRVDRLAGGTLRSTPVDELGSIATEAYFSETLALPRGEVYHSDIVRVVDSAGDEPVSVVRLTTPVYEQGKVAGLLMIKLYADRLFRDLLIQPGGSELRLISADGRYLSDILAGRMQAPRAQVDIGDEERAFHFHPRTMEVDGYQKIYFSTHDRQHYWILSVHVSRAAVMDAFVPTLERMWLSTLLIGLLLVVLTLWYLSRAVMTPIVNLAEIADRLRANEVDVQIPVDNVKDEMQTLYRAIGDYAEAQQWLTSRLLQQVDMQTRRLAAVVDHAVDGIITISDSGVVESFNPAAGRIFGYDAVEVIGNNVAMLMSDHDRERHDQYLKRYLELGEHRVIDSEREVTGRRKSGELFPMELAVSELGFEDEHHYIGIVRDISERKRNEETIRHMAHHDMLTGLPNRILFSDRVEQAIREARRARLNLALFFIDLDGFKAVNDKLGHEAGDHLLRDVAARMRQHVREVDSIARLGGDEFAILLFDVKDCDSVAHKASELIASISEPYPELSDCCEIGCSIGIACYPEDADNRQDLLNHADTAMYEVKSAGKNHYRFFGSTK